MNLKDLSNPLPIESVDFRIQSINKGGYATILAYKDARVDMNILDRVCGVENWQREHFENMLARWKLLYAKITLTTEST